MPAAYLGLLLAAVILAAALTIGLVAGMIGPGAIAPVLLVALALRIALFIWTHRR
ncbi:MAG: hypothetical protein ACK5JR_04995 [Tropicimonas sp.]|uniref:hypothetical protein n=1 Tax=Tropicimonas sp. TaxID=2067044 RepID=UPI003A8AF812